MAEEAEQTAGSEKLKQLYPITRKLLGKYGKQGRPANDKEGGEDNHEPERRTDRTFQRTAKQTHFTKLSRHPTI